MLKKILNSYNRAFATSLVFLDSAKSLSSVDRPCFSVVLRLSFFEDEGES